MTQTLCTVALAVRSPGSASPRLNDLHPGLPVRTLTPVPPQEVVRRAMRDVLDHLAGPDRGRVPAFVAAAPYAAYTATYFAERHEDPARRLRPSHSIQMECSRLVQGLDDDLDEADRWAGDIFFLCTPERDVQQSIRGAEAALAVGAPAALVCDITVAPGDADGKPALSAGAVLLIGAAADTATGDLGPWPPAAAAHRRVPAGARA